MSIRVPRPVLFILSLIVGIVLYWKSFSGTPIWDDYHYWFHDLAMRPEVSFLNIWANFTWPFSVSLQKISFALWDNSYPYYHSLNFIIHCGNAWLVYLLGQQIKLKYAGLFSLMFFVHPACMITVAWMIQFKTLVCFFFAIAALLTFMKGIKNHQWFIFSWGLFFLSVTSKSASLTLPLILLIIGLRNLHWKKMLWILPYFVISFWGGYKVLTSAITIQGVAKATNNSKPIEASVPEIKVAPQAVQKPKEAPSIVKEPILVQKPIEAPSLETGPPLIQKPSESHSLDLGLNFALISQTLYYYFWQSILPLRNEPLKGLNFKKFGSEEIVHLLFIVLLIGIFWKKEALIYLGATHFLLLPFLGIIPAPFMSITWVSDQHLYLVLPALLAFWFKIAETLPGKTSWILPSIFVLFFSYKTFKASAFYKDQITFYEVSLALNPHNIPISFNLAYAFIEKRDWKNAYEVVSNAYHLSQSEPLMQKNSFYPPLEAMYFKMKASLERK